jgi:hypothetical protein
MCITQQMPVVSSGGDVVLCCTVLRRLRRDNLSLRLFLLSPASGSVWLALFYPLPMSLHLLLLGLSSLVAVWRTDSLEHRLLRLETIPEHLMQTYQRLSRFSRCAVAHAARGADMHGCSGVVELL